jgi:hypothetical protein
LLTENLKPALEQWKQMLIDIEGDRLNEGCIPVEKFADLNPETLLMMQYSILGDAISMLHDEDVDPDRKGVSLDRMLTVMSEVLNAQIVQVKLPGLLYYPPKGKTVEDILQDAEGVTVFKGKGIFQA